jgi:hypothetical protein
MFPRIGKTQNLQISRGERLIDAGLRDGAKE